MAIAFIEIPSTACLSEPSEKCSYWERMIQPHGSLCRNSHWPIHCFSFANVSAARDAEMTRCSVAVISIASEAFIRFMKIHLLFSWRYANIIFLRKVEVARISTGPFFRWLQSWYRQSGKPLRKFREVCPQQTHLSSPRGRNPWLFLENQIQQVMEWPWNCHCFCCKEDWHKGTRV